MKIFVFEYTSGGGLRNEEISHPRLHSGMLRHASLLDNLSRIPAVKLITTRDSRLDLQDISATVMPVHNHYLGNFYDGVEQADAVWIMAPESGGILANLSRKVLKQKRLLLGSSPAAVKVASSKLLTARKLASAGIAVVDTYTPQDDLPDNICAWVVKPDQGTACLNTRIFRLARDALEWIASQTEDHYVLQPFITGQACSLCLLCRNGDAQVLSCNEQRVALRDNHFHFLGSTVNNINDVNGELQHIAQKIALVMPGLWGHVGVDYIQTKNGAVVLEINPQITTSFVGLHTSTGDNPAQLTLDLLNNPIKLPSPKKPAVAVSVDLAAFDAF